MKFILLKRTYPISKYTRNCDGFEYIIKHTSSAERKEWDVDGGVLQKIIKNGERYIYQVAKEGSELKVMHMCFNNYKLIRKYLKIYVD